MCSTTFYHIKKVSRFFRCLKNFHLDLSPMLHKDLPVPLITNGLKSKKDYEAFVRHLEFFTLTDSKPRDANV